MTEFGLATRDWSITGQWEGEGDGPTFEGELLLLFLERLDEFLVLALALLALQLFGGDRLARAGLRVRVVRRPARSLLRVLLFAPLGPSVLKPNLEAPPEPARDRKRKEKNQSSAPYGSICSGSCDRRCDESSNTNNEPTSQQLGD